MDMADSAGSGNRTGKGARKRAALLLRLLVSGLFFGLLVVVDVVFGFVGLRAVHDDGRRSADARRTDRVGVGVLLEILLRDDLERGQTIAVLQVDETDTLRVAPHAAD